MTPRAPDAFDEKVHVVQRMIERRVTWTEIEAVVADPQKSVPGHSGRTNLYGVVNGYRLRVTVDATGAVFTVAIAGRRA